jgi:hypothetical protein
MAPHLTTSLSQFFQILFMVQSIDTRRHVAAMGPAGVLPSASMPNSMLPHAGNQQDLNYVMNLLNQLSEQVRQNREQTEHIVEGVRQMHSKKAATSSQSSSPATSFPQVVEANESESNGGDPPNEDNPVQESPSTFCPARSRSLPVNILRRPSCSYCHARAATLENNTRTRCRPCLRFLLGSCKRPLPSRTFYC